MFIFHIISLLDNVSVLLPNMSENSMRFFHFLPFFLFILSSVLLSPFTCLYFIWIHSFVFFFALFCFHLMAEDENCYMVIYGGY